VVHKYLSGIQSEFRFSVWHDGARLGYVGLGAHRITIGVLDLAQLAQAGLILLRQVAQNVYLGKPTAAGIAAITEGRSDRSLQIRLSDHISIAVERTIAPEVPHTT